jgi:hypothetical protein
MGGAIEAVNAHPGARFDIILTSAPAATSTDPHARSAD